MRAGEKACMGFRPVANPAQLTGAAAHGRYSAFSQLRQAVTYKSAIDLGGQMSNIRNVSGSTKTKRSRTIKLAPMTRAVRSALAVSALALAIGASGGAFAAGHKIPQAQVLKVERASIDFAPVHDLTAVASAHLDGSAGRAPPDPDQRVGDRRRGHRQCRSDRRRQHLLQRHRHQRLQQRRQRRHHQSRGCGPARGIARRRCDRHLWLRGHWRREHRQRRRRSSPTPSTAWPTASSPPAPMST